MFIDAGRAWQADHIKAVHQGGGLCSVSNLQTLCTVCHMQKTDRQNRERKLGHPIKVKARAAPAPVAATTGGRKRRRILHPADKQPMQEKAECQAAHAPSLQQRSGKQAAMVRPVHSAVDAIDALMACDAPTNGVNV